ncbi:MAG: sulfurtransferase complex subunit TusC [Gammaproteobacteria bacterium]|nr:sulfurtransferase complex subunit TusC [Gammaproteobacteria bacterium]
MKNILLIHTSSSLNTLAGKEALDLSLIFGAYEQQVSVLFYHHGVTQTIAHQDPELVKQKDYLSTIKALDIYDIDKVFVSENCLSEFNLQHAELLSGIEPIDIAKIEQLKNDADHIYVI